MRSQLKQFSWVVSVHGHLLKYKNGCELRLYIAMPMMGRQYVLQTELRMIMVKLERRAYINTTKQGSDAVHKLSGKRCSCH